MYFEACNVLLGELQNRFESKTIPAVVSMEKALIKAANNQEFESEMKKVEKSCFSKDINFFEYRKQLQLLHGAVTVKTVTSIHTICDAMNERDNFKELLSSIHGLLRLTLTVPISSVTAERTLFALKFVFTSQCSTVTEKRLNNCLLLHIHQELTDSMNLIEVTKEFVGMYDTRRKYFGNFL